MLGNDSSSVDAQDNNSNIRENSDVYSLESQHRLIVNWTPPNGRKFFLKHRFGSPIVLNKSIPQRKKNLFRFKINRSLNFDSANSRKESSFKSSSKNDSFDMTDRLSRDLSRSAKIMRALSCNRHSFHRNVTIKKSLNFDLSPSAMKQDIFDRNSSSIDRRSNTILVELDELSRPDVSSNDTSDNNVPSVSSESIDENQNRTPQQNLMTTKTSSYANHPDTNEDTSESESPVSTSFLRRSSFKQRLDNSSTPTLGSFKRRNDRFVRPSYDLATSTPRNLFRDFNDDQYDRPRTPENMIRIIPEGISAIKKSHRKERLYRREKQAFMRQQNDSTNKKENSGLIWELSKINNTTPARQSRDNSKSIRKTLIYSLDNEISDNELNFSCVNEKKVISMEKDDLIENGLNNSKDDKFENADTNNFEKCKNSLTNDVLSGEENERFDKYLLYNDGSSGNHKTSYENGSASPDSDKDIYQERNVTVTPENRVNIIERVFAESIKKSHKKMKNDYRRASVKPNILDYEMETTKAETLPKDPVDKNDQLNNVTENKRTDEICISNVQNRSCTPENVYSSRLLLPIFNSIKKSHRKDKRIKRVSGVGKHENKYYEKSVNLSDNDSCEREDINGTNLSLNKRKQLTDVVSRSSTKNLKYPDESLPFERKSINDQFMIHTPVKRRVPITPSNCVCVDEVSSDNGKSTRTRSQEIDFSRCVTPIAHCFGNMRPKEYFTSTKCSNVLKSQKDVCVLNDDTIITQLEIENGRSTPTDMSTTELLCNIDSIKKSHKKIKHSRNITGCRVLKGNIISANDTVTLKEKTTLECGKHYDVDGNSMKIETSSDTYDDICNGTKNKKYEETVYKTQPSTSRNNNNIEDARNAKHSRLTNVTPPNCIRTTNFVKLLHTTSIKRSHKKERSHNSQAKYILMTKEHELSDDGSIFDEEDRLISVAHFASYQDSDNEVTCN